VRGALPARLLDHEAGDVLGLIRTHKVVREEVEQKNGASLLRRRASLWYV
jgi:hypothetical protein